MLVMPVTRLLCAALAVAVLILPPAASAAGWSSGVPVSGPGAASPSVVADGAGAVTAVWLRGGVVEVADRGASGTFPAPQALSGTGASDASLATNPAGRAVAVWVRDGSVRAALRPGAGQPWQAAQEISSPGTVQRPVAGVDTSGNVTVGWIRGNVVEVVRRAGGAWGTVQQFTEAQPQRLALAVAPGGAATAVWTVEVSGGYDMRTVFRAPGAASFTGPPATLESYVEDIVGYAPAVRVAVDGTGAFTTVWTNHQLAPQPRAPVIRAARRTPGASFGPAATISGGSVNDKAADPHPDLALNAAGDALVVWNRWFEDVATVQGARRPGPGAFDAPLTAGGPGVAPQGAPAAALDAQGRGAAVWSQSGAIHGSRLTGAFAMPEVLSGAGATTSPDVVFDAAGNAVAVWTRDGRVESAAYDVVAPTAGEVSAPAAGATGEDLRFSGSGGDGESATEVSWSFGDGTTGTGPEVTHAYAAAGTYDVVMTVTDGGGNSVSAAKRTVTVTGRDQPSGGDAPAPGGDSGTPSGPGGPSGPAGPAGPSRPEGGPDLPAAAARLTSLRVRPATLRSGRRARVTFSLDRAARVVLTVQRAVKGGTRTRWKRAGRPVTVAGRAGANAVSLPARRLRPGRHRLVARVDGGAATRLAVRVARHRAA
jgi:hypothetical protein